MIGQVVRVVKRILHIEYAHAQVSIREARRQLTANVKGQGEKAGRLFRPEPAERLARCPLGVLVSDTHDTASPLRRHGTSIIS
jgi:hypothetical protein